MFNSSYIVFSDKIRHALDNKRPVLALESSVIAQGLPYPVNMELAEKLEDLAESLDVTPATIAIINGKIKIGLNRSDIEKLATEQGLFKVSKRDIPLVIAREGSGGTTVASTSFIASKAGIKVFATGGIGGVHTGGENTFDISADLTELSQTDTVVVSAGPKSIIDLKLTLEYLETHSVPVIGYKTDTCPHFFLGHSKYPVSMKADTVDDIVKIMKLKEKLSLQGGILVVNPLKEEYCLSENEFTDAHTKALQEAREKKIAGNKITPFLLEKINMITSGKSQKANLILLEENVKLASEISKTYSKI
jgi:pseudouridine-5'-phosphate glycosidase